MLCCGTPHCRVSLGSLCKCQEVFLPATSPLLCHPPWQTAPGLGWKGLFFLKSGIFQATGFTRNQKKAFFFAFFLLFLIDKAFSRWIPAPFWRLQPRAPPSSANASAFPGSAGMRVQFVSHRKFHRQNANSQFQALFRNIFCVSCCCKEPRRGGEKKKNPNKISLSLFSATHFSAPVKQNVSCKPGGRHKVKREGLLLCSAVSLLLFLFPRSSCPFLLPVLYHLPHYPSPVLPQLNFSGPSFASLLVPFILWVSSRASCCVLSLIRAQSGNIPPFSSLGWNYWFSNCWDCVGLL